ncbi:MAG: ABC transporter ATP-binding protein [Clostridiaceae bacterium]|nr:ABC transporter ATP-binding protein [Clostridiaceae bacterium]
MATQTTIEFRKINKSYEMGQETLHVLKDIDFTVDQGEFVAVLGPSGSGKSTLMNIIGCIDVADTGEYFLHGHAVHAMNEAQMTRLRNELIGFVFQNYNLIPTYSVMQNIIMPLLVRGMNHKEAEAQAMDTLSLLGLDNRLKHKPSELSGGQQQRVSIARALVGEPAVLLADEPTGALDTASGHEVLKLFKRLNDMGNTIVMITHNMDVAKAAGRVVRIVDGELFQS